MVNVTKKMFTAQNTKMVDVQNVVIHFILTHKATVKE